MGRNTRDIKPCEVEEADVNSLNQGAFVTDGEEVEVEPFFQWIKRIIEVLVVAFEKRPDVLPTIPDFIRMVQIYREIGESEEPSKVEIIWQDPFAPKLQ